jgi:hypothetical protein
MYEASMLTRTTSVGRHLAVGGASPPSSRRGVRLAGAGASALKADILRGGAGGRHVLGELLGGPPRGEEEATDDTTGGAAGKTARAPANVARYVVAQRLDQESERLAMLLRRTWPRRSARWRRWRRSGCKGSGWPRCWGTSPGCGARSPRPTRGGCCALVEQVVVDERSGRVEVHLVNFAADTEVDVVTSEEEPEDAAV